MTTPPDASPKLHDLSSTAYTKGLTSPGHSGHLGLQPPASEVPAMQEVPRPMAVQPNSPEQPPPARLQPQVSPHVNSSCPLGCQQVLCPNSPSSPLPPAALEPACLQPSALPPDVGHQQQQPQKVQRNESPAALPAVREDSDHNLAPIPVVIKQEPEELDQLYLDDGKCLQPSRCVHSHGVWEGRGDMGGRQSPCCAVQNSLQPAGCMSVVLLW